MLVGDGKHPFLKPCASNGAVFFTSTSALDADANIDSDRPTEQPSSILQTTLSQIGSTQSSRGNFPSLPPLDIEAATSANEQSKMSQWSTTDSCWSPTPNGLKTAVESSISSSVEKDNLYKERSVRTHDIENSTPSLKVSSNEKSSLSILSLQIPDASLRAEDSSEVLAMSLLRKIALVLVASSAQFLNLGGMNQTVAPVMILADYFQIRDYGTLSWFSASYSMSVGTFILPAGRLGDMYGHKTIFAIGWVWFAVVSAITGFSYKSKDIILFSVCRALQGIGPALLVPNAIALLGMNFPVGLQRNTAFACFGAAGPLGATAGAVFTALIADRLWWPWSFWILAMVCMVVCVLSLIIVPGRIFRLLPAKDARPTFDYWGCLTGVSGLILINFALNQAPQAGWATWYIYTTLLLGFACISAFVIIELNCTDYPLVPLRGLGSEAYFALGCIVAGWSSHGIWAYYLYLLLEQVRGHTALLTSAETSPVAVTGIFFAISTVWLVKKFGVAYVMLIAMINFLIGSLLLALVPIHQSYWIQTFLSIIIMPGAMNLSFPAATILLSSALPNEKQGIAASLVSTMVNYCISCGLGLAGSIHRKSFENALIKRGRDHRVPLSKLPLLTANPPGLDEIRIESFRGPWFFAVALSFIGVLIAVCFILRSRRISERKSIITARKHGLRRVFLCFSQGP
ncbi:hypothetical protein FKW77_010558 [Venturia effusa]|uniref:Major facilitator superfamily (MFS) profile domain-containing protein n=1 Tax=Venturia effusa TaxID=50376 RepID=A0A517L0K1_9PEZI|nr:hypothetical protein FKW77_010558 [Venturia effusa]